jgi:hypothetical protein
MEERKTPMRRRITMLIMAAMLALTTVAGPVASGAFAAPECPDGSKPVNNQGTKSCTTTAGPNDQFTCVDEQKGSFSSSHPRDEENLNPSENENNSVHCR